MPLFMFASGFVYIATKRDIKYQSFLWKKIKRLMVPYWVVSIMIITIKLFTQGRAYIENPVTPFSYIKILYLPEAGYFLWFIWALWWMFVIIPFFKTATQRLGLFLLAVFLPLLSSYMPNEFCIKEFSKMLQYFVAGILVYDYKQHFIHLKDVPLFIAFSLFCLIETIPYLGLGRAPSLFIAFIGIAFVLKFSYTIEKRVNTSKWGIMVMTTSAASYTIYLLHTIFEGFMKALIIKLPCLSDSSNDFMFSTGALIVIITGCVIPVLLYKYLLSRYYITKILFGLK